MYLWRRFLQILAITPQRAISVRFLQFLTNLAFSHVFNSKDLSRFNTTVLAYGATGNGKTFTMRGINELPGLIPMAMSTILSMCEKTGNKAKILYYKIYMDRCWDLLEVKPNEIAILDDKDGQVHLKGLSSVLINSIILETTKFFVVEGTMYHKIGRRV